MKKFFLWIIPLLVFAFQLSAQTKNNYPYSVQGQLVDSTNNEQVAYATVKIMQANNPSTAVDAVVCDEQGKFTVKLKAPGAYVMEGSFLGKKTVRRPFTLKQGQPVVHLGKMDMPNDDQMLGTVTVTAQKPLVKVGIDKITYSLADDPESVTNNTLDMLRKVPMITVDGDDQIQLKGSTNFKIYLNGKPSNLITNNPADVLKSMPANSIKDIEVITEPGAKYDAEGVGGIINIITKSALQGYTGTLRADGDTQGSVGGGGYFSLKAGKFGVTANYNYRYRNSPYTDYNSYRENLTNDQLKYLTQGGRSKRKGPFQYGYVEATYEIDTLNLLSLSGNLFDGKSRNYSNTHEQMRNLTMDPVYEFERNSESEKNFGGSEVNLDFQHSTHLKDELLTLSYKFNNSPDNNESTTLIDEILHSDLYNPNHKEWTKNKAYTREHTGQLDYTRPMFKNQTLEVGAKYIYRNSDSKTTRFVNDKEEQDPSNNFSHIQHIYSGYASYSLKWNKFGFKAGARLEGTRLKVESDQNFKSNYFDAVPSATVSYQLGAAQNLRLGYNMRIQRPGIWYLNPYVNKTDPLNISYGNPDLKSEKSHNINLNYGMFGQKVNFNASVNYTFVNNAIEQYTFQRANTPDVLETTYDNIGHNHNVGLYLYGSWTPVGLLRIFTNAGMNYQDMSSDNYGANSGMNYNVFLGTEFSFPLDFRLNLNGGYFSPRILLQGKSSSFYFTSIRINKSFFNKKLTLSVFARDPFWKNKEMKTTTQDEFFYMRTINHMAARSFGISVSYTFGEMKSAIKKVRRGISNDDMKSGSDDSQGGQGSAE